MQKGRLTYADGSVYVQISWACGRRRAGAALAWPDGETYEGQYAFGDKEGLGHTPTAACTKANSKRGVCTAKAPTPSRMAVATLASGCMPQVL